MSVCVVRSELKDEDKVIIPQCIFARLSVIAAVTYCVAVSYVQKDNHVFHSKEDFICKLTEWQPLEPRSRIEKAWDELLKHGYIQCESDEKQKRVYLTYGEENGFERVVFGKMPRGYVA